MPKFRRISFNRHPNGYVLLMTLLLLVIVAATMTIACRTSLQSALQAEDDERLVRSRWAAISCQMTLLHNCERILGDQERRSRHPVVSWRSSVALCGKPVQLIFGDEAAKVNVQSMYKKSGKADTLLQLRQLLSGSGIAGRVHLRPASFSAGPTLGPRPASSPEMASYGAIVDLPDPAELIQSRYGVPCPADVFSCWGDGRINWRRASEKTLRATLSPPLSFAQVQRLIAARESSPNNAPLNLDNALDAAGLTRLQRAAARSSLAEASQCHSLWILTTAGDRTIYHYFVSETVGPSEHVTGFEW